jgi:SAM-dependent methyltransferase
MHTHRPYAVQIRFSNPACNEDNDPRFASLQIELPDGNARLGLGCADPQTLHDLQPGETVLGIGTAGGLDLILAAETVGPDGHIIGINLNMTPGQYEQTQAAARLGLTNLEFRQGRIDQLPVPDRSVDVTIVNCIPDLSLDQPQVFTEIFRLLKPGGRVAFHDVYAHHPHLDRIQGQADPLEVSSPSIPELSDFIISLVDAGFTEVTVRSSGTPIELEMPSSLNNVIFSATLTARKPSDEQGVPS